MGYKEVWCGIWDLFVEDHGREPTVDEMHELWADYCGGLIDCYGVESW